ncbi:SCO7613 C-terminal domain-containing membrane protein [Nocardioides speluncae]|uniref:SCO7613 C-terminal domain-containing membrane protein n=1 Tax=Nocardioides speluncae TaxID=2670337 RepID=UPI000D688F9A|nr:hypothetical protein [Nocardioides speluncae]
MTRFADPQKCPDCGAPITPGAPACVACRLPLTGITAQTLFQTLQRADLLLTQLRTSDASVGAAAPMAPPQPAMHPHRPPPVFTPGPLPTAPPLPPSPAPPRRGLSAPSVPKILLGLGALCLLVAALVFLAFAWSVLGVGGRTAVLVGLTLLAGAGSLTSAKFDLRGAAESLAVVTFGFVGLDIAGAANAGWFGDAGIGALLMVTGVTVGVLGAGGALAGAALPIKRLVVAELGVAGGTALTVIGSLAAANDDHGVVLTLGLAGAVLVAYLGYRLRLVVAAFATTVVAGFTWLSLTINGFVQASDEPTLAAMYGELNAWTLLVAIVAMAAVALVRPLPVWARVGAATIAAVVAVFTLTLPVLDETATRTTLAWLLVLAVTAVATYVVPNPWRAVPAAPMVIAAIDQLVVQLTLSGQALGRLAPESAWAAPTGVRLPDEAAAFAPWILVPSFLCLVAAGVATARFWVNPLPTVQRYAVPLGAAVLLAGLATLALYPVPVAVVLAGLVAVAVAVGAWTQLAAADARWPWLAPAAVVLLLAVGTALVDEVLTALVLAVVVAAAAALEWAGRPAVARQLGEAVLAPALAGLIWTVAEIGALPTEHRAVPILLLVGGLAIARPRVVGEISSALAMLVTAGVATAAADRPQTWLAVHLTLAGAVVVTSSLVNRDRRLLGWLGGALLAAATWVRLEEIGVTEPEPYTLPTALALLVVGLLHLRRRPETSTYTALMPGLALALVPSLLWALTDPVSLRALLLGVGCLALVLVGVQLKWSAPLVAGATAGGLLVLREAAPYAGSVPQWATIGLAGTLLLVLGITWERRLREVRLAGTYLRALR